ncbi:hypothetical protein [Mangrovimonas xylaniphaga]|uniref:hypothetical protein n=1 Tax=Mangrovimonas xylaniphaga TaxID=1645915 RepID=UPI0006B44705|nr:hypothetical protein [Mangrovimonas xylaniphaga]
MKKVILITLISSLILGLGYFGLDMFDFAKEAKTDIKKNVEKSINIEDSNRIEQKKEFKLDTIDIENFNIIFFHPNENEFEELLKEQNDENSGLYEVDSDYAYYANNFLDSISKTDLKTKIITERIIKYSTKNGIKYLDRLKNPEHPYGIIFNNVICDPQIEFGVMTDIDIFQLLAEYNKNCK